MNLLEMFQPLQMSAGQVLLIMSVFTIASFLQSSAGFGAVILSAPFLVLIEPRFVPGPMLLAGVLISALVITRDGLHADFGNVLRLSFARVVGSGVGAVILLRLSADGVAAVLAAFLLISIGFSIRGWSIPITRRSLAVIGFVAGVAGTVAGLAGATTALLFQNERGVSLRVRMATYLLPGSIISLGSVALVGRMTSVEILLFLKLVPCIFLGHLISSRYGTSLDRFISRPLLLTLAGLSAVGVIVKLLIL